MLIALLSQASALAAFAALSDNYYATDPTLTSVYNDTVVHALLRHLALDAVQHAPSYTRHGPARACGCLPPQLVADPAIVLARLLQATAVADGAECLAPARAAAVRGLIGLTCSGVFAVKDAPVATVTAQLCRSLGDYSVDSRGDIGSTVRMAGMQGLVTCLLHWAQHGSEGLSVAMVLEAFCLLLKQASEKIDRVRTQAGSCLLELARQLPAVYPDMMTDPNVRSVVTTLLGLPPDFDWAAGSVVYPMLADLLPLAPLRKYLLQGFVATVGGLTESLIQHASAALLNVLDGASLELVTAIAQDLVDVGGADLADLRVTMAYFDTLTTLLSSGGMDALRLDAVVPLQMHQQVAKVYKGTSNVKLLLRCVEVSAALLAFEAAQKAALKTGLVLICNKYPRVGSCTCMHASALLCFLPSPQHSLASRFARLPLKPWSWACRLRLPPVPGYQSSTRTACWTHLGKPSPAIENASA